MNSSKTFSTYSGVRIPQSTESKKLPLRFHISFKEQERSLLAMEQQLMRHFRMNRSDLHKYFIRMNYNLIVNQNPLITIH